MLSAEEWALLNREERISWERAKGSERDNYERILRERIAQRTDGSPQDELSKHVTQPSADDGALGGIGMLLVFAGLGLICFAIWIFDTAPSGTHNIGLLNQQSGMTILGSTLAICGSVFFAAQRIMQRRS